MNGAQNFRSNNGEGNGHEGANGNNSQGRSNEFVDSLIEEGCLQGVGESTCINNMQNNFTAEGNNQMMHAQTSISSESPNFQNMVHAPYCFDPYIFYPNNNFSPLHIMHIPNNGISQFHENTTMQHNPTNFNGLNRYPMSSPLLQVPNGPIIPHPNQTLANPARNSYNNSDCSDEHVNANESLIINNQNLYGMNLPQHSMSSQTQLCLSNRQVDNDFFMMTPQNQNHMNLTNHNYNTCSNMVAPNFSNVPLDNPYMNACSNNQIPMQPMNMFQLNPNNCNMFYTSNRNNLMTTPNTYINNNHSNHNATNTPPPLVGNNSIDYSNFSGCEVRNVNMAHSMNSQTNSISSKVCSILSQPNPTNGMLMNRQLMHPNQGNPMIFNSTQPQQTNAQPFVRNQLDSVPQRTNSLHWPNRHLPFTNISDSFSVNNASNLSPNSDSREDAHVHNASLTSVGNVSEMKTDETNQRKETNLMRTKDPCIQETTDNDDEAGDHEAGDHEDGDHEDGDHEDGGDEDGDDEDDSDYEYSIDEDSDDEDDSDYEYSIDEDGDDDHSIYEVGGDDDDSDADIRSNRRQHSYVKFLITEIEETSKISKQTVDSCLTPGTKYYMRLYRIHKLFDDFNIKKDKSNAANRYLFAHGLHTQIMLRLKDGHAYCIFSQTNLHSAIQNKKVKNYLIKHFEAEKNSKQKECEEYDPVIFPFGQSVYFIFKKMENVRRGLRKIYKLYNMQEIKILMDKVPTVIRKNKDDLCNVILNENDPLHDIIVDYIKNAMEVNGMNFNNPDFSDYYKTKKPRKSRVSNIKKNQKNQKNHLNLTNNKNENSHSDFKPNSQGKESSEIQAQSYLESNKESEGKEENKKLVSCALEESQMESIKELNTESKTSEPSTLVNQPFSTTLKKRGRKRKQEITLEDGRTIKGVFATPDGSWSTMSNNKVIMNVDGIEGVQNKVCAPNNQVETTNDPNMNTSVDNQDVLANLKSNIRVLDPQKKDSRDWMKQELKLAENYISDISDIVSKHTQQVTQAYNYNYEKSFNQPTISLSEVQPNNLERTKPMNPESTNISHNYDTSKDSLEKVESAKYATCSSVPENTMKVTNRVPSFSVSKFSEQDARSIETPERKQMEQSTNVPINPTLQNKRRLMNGNFAENYIEEETVTLNKNVINATGKEMNNKTLKENKEISKKEKQMITHMPRFEWMTTEDVTKLQRKRINEEKMLEKEVRTFEKAIENTSNNGLLNLSKISDMEDSGSSSSEQKVESIQELQKKSERSNSNTSEQRKKLSKQSSSNSCETKLGNKLSPISDISEDGEDDEHEENKDECKKNQPVEDLDSNHLSSRNKHLSYTESKGYFDNKK